MVPCADRAPAARAPATGIRALLRQCRAKACRRGTRLDTALLSRAAGTVALCRPISGGYGAVVRKGAAGSRHAGAQPILDWTALAGVTRLSWSLTRHCVHPAA